MKIIQSYWTKPSLKENNLHATDRNNGGWLHRKYHYFSWALSCLSFRNFYREVELYADVKSANLLVEKLELPYSKVHIVLDELNDYEPDLWALGKLYTYGLQKTPFLHVDGDIFIWKNFDIDFLKSSLIAQNPENNFDYYLESFKEIQSKFEYIPEVIRAHFEVNKSFQGVNAGILGGSDILFIKEYVKTAFKFVDENKNYLKEMDIGLFNNFYEQCLFKTMTIDRKIGVSYLKKEVNDRFDGLVDFTGVPNNLWYIHTVGVYKKRLETCQMMEFQLKKNFPEYYFRIISLLKKYHI